VVPAPPNNEADVVLGVPKVDEVVVLPPKGFLLASAALGVDPSPLKNPPPPPPEPPKTLVVGAAALVVGAAGVAGGAAGVPPGLPAAGAALPPNTDV